MNINKLKGKIVEKQMNVETLAELIGIDRATFYRKLNRSDKFTIGDVINMKIALELTDQEAYEIFLAE